MQARVSAIPLASVRTLVSAMCAMVLLVVLALPGAAAEDSRTVPLPDGFQPEGIATKGRAFFVGSIPTGAIYKGDLKTGEVSLSNSNPKFADDAEVQEAIKTAKEKIISGEIKVATS